MYCIGHMAEHGLTPRGQARRPSGQPSGKRVGRAVAGAGKEEAEEEEGEWSDSGMSGED